MQEELNNIIQREEIVLCDAAMSESLACSDNPVSGTDRRLGRRQQVSSIMYVKLGEHNGGVTLNVSEGGLAVQAAMALMHDTLPLRFQLSANKWVEASARIVWLTQSKKTAGLHFNDLSEKSRKAIREWLGVETEDFPSKAPAEEENLPSFDAMPHNLIKHIESNATQENQQDSIPATHPEVPPSSLKATVPSVIGLSSSPRRDELSEKRMPHESVPPEARPSGAPDNAHVLPASFIAARLRRYLVDERHRIRLYDLVSKETETLCAQLTETNFPPNVPVTVEEFLTRIHRYEELSEVLLSIVATGCFWGDRNIEPIWAKIVERVATVGATNAGKPQWISLRFYPALLLLYAGGLALVAKGNYSVLAALLLQPKLKCEDGNYCLIERLYASSVIGDERFRIALCGARRYTLPANAYLYGFFRERLGEFIPSETEYSGVFDRFEYLLALVWTDQNPNSTRVDWVPVGGPLGLFVSKALGRTETSIIEHIDRELSDLGKSCPVLRSGLFGGSPGRLRSASQRIAAQIQLEQNDAALPKQTLQTPARNQSISPRSSGASRTAFPIMSQIFGVPSWFRAREKLGETLAQETLIRVCVVSRDPALIEEVHKDLLVGFLTRAGYEFESDHPDFQEYCDVLFLDLRAAGLQADLQEGLAFIDAVCKSVLHPPIVVLCDTDAGEFAREVMQRGAYDKLTTPLNMPQLRLALQCAYEFRSAETKLESFLSQETTARDRPRSVRARKACPSPRPATVAPRPVRRTRPQRGPSRRAVGFVLCCVLFFAGLVAVRTILVGMGDALTGADARPGKFASHRARPLPTTADFTQHAFETELNSPATPHSSLPGYESASIIERVAPRYSADARARHLEGTVHIRAIIGANGTPRGLGRVSGDPTLAQIAMDAISLWRYQPATVDGDPVESEVIIPVDFQLPD